MSGGEAADWQALMNNYIDKEFLTFENFANDLKRAFAPTNTVGDAIHRLTNMTQGKHPAEELVTDFKLALMQA